MGMCMCILAYGISAKIDRDSNLRIIIVRLFYFQVERLRGLNGIEEFNTEGLSASAIKRGPVDSGKGVRIQVRRAVSVSSARHDEYGYELKTFYFLFTSPFLSRILAGRQGV